MSFTPPEARWLRREQLVFDGAGHHLELERTADIARIIVERVEAP